MRIFKSIKLILSIVFLGALMLMYTGCGSTSGSSKDGVKSAISSDYLKRLGGKGFSESESQYLSSGTSSSASRGATRLQAQHLQSSDPQTNFGIAAKDYILPVMKNIDAAAANGFTFTDDEKKIAVIELAGALASGVQNDKDALLDEAHKAEIFGKVMEYTVGYLPYAGFDPSDIPALTSDIAYNFVYACTDYLGFLSDDDMAKNMRYMTEYMGPAMIMAGVPEGQLSDAMTEAITDFSANAYKLWPTDTDDYKEAFQYMTEGFMASSDDLGVNGSSDATYKYTAMIYDATATGMKSSGYNPDTYIPKTEYYTWMGEGLADAGCSTTYIDYAETTLGSYNYQTGDTVVTFDVATTYTPTTTTTNAYLYCSLYKDYVSGNLTVYVSSSSSSAIATLTFNVYSSESYGSQGSLLQSLTLSSVTPSAATTLSGFTPVAATNYAYTCSDGTTTSSTSYYYAY